MILELKLNGFDYFKHVSKAIERIITISVDTWHKDKKHNTQMDILGREVQENNAQDNFMKQSGKMGLKHQTCNLRIQN